MELIPCSVFLLSFRLRASQLHTDDVPPKRAIALDTFIPPPASYSGASHLIFALVPVQKNEHFYQVPDLQLGYDFVFFHFRQFY
jgi:hypothetical protein